MIHFTRGHATLQLRILNKLAQSAGVILEMAQDGPRWPAVARDGKLLAGKGTIVKSEIPCKSRG